jgi:hypothetical protein
VQTVDRLTVHWPDGGESLVEDVPTNRLIKLAR